MVHSRLTTITRLRCGVGYDQKRKRWKIIWHNKRWTGDELTENGCPGWRGVEAPRDNRMVSDIIANVQTGTGNWVRANWVRPTGYGQLHRVVGQQR